MGQVKRYECVLDLETWFLRKSTNHQMLDFRNRILKSFEI